MFGSMVKVMNAAVCEESLREERELRFDGGWVDMKDWLETKPFVESPARGALESMFLTPSRIDKCTKVSIPN